MKVEFVVSVSSLGLHELLHYRPLALHTSLCCEASPSHRYQMSLLSFVYLHMQMHLFALKKEAVFPVERKQIANRSAKPNVVVSFVGNKSTAKAAFFSKLQMQLDLGNFPA